MLLSLIAQLAEASMPVWLGMLVSQVAKHSVLGVMTLGWVLVVAVMVRVLASVTAHVLGTDTSITLSVLHREKITKHVISHRHVAQDADLSTGDFVEIADEDSDAIASGFDAVRSLFASLGVYTAAGVYLVSQSRVVGITILVAVPVMCLCLPVILNRLRTRLSLHRNAAGIVTSMAVDAASGQRVLKGVSGQSVFMRRFLEASSDMRERGLSVAGLRALIDGLRELIPAVLLLAVLAVSLLQWGNDALSVGQLVSFYGLATYLLQPVTSFIEACQNLMPALVGLDRENRVLNSGASARSGVSPAPQAVCVMDPESGVTAYAGEYTVIASDSFDDMRIIASRLSGTDEELKGRLNGNSYSIYSETSIRATALLLDTDARVVSGTIKDILDGGKNDMRRREALDVSVLGELADLCSGDVLDMEVTDSGRNLSGGQLQRLLLAKAIAADRSVLVLVDPTSAVDSVTEQEIIARVKADRRTRITVVATRSPAHIRAADTVYWIQDGKIKGHGTNAELMNNQGYRDWMRRMETV
jgi:ABC-type bacteriocin/lantibiotic exporter with double-glycine peptidase domain